MPLLDEETKNEIKKFLSNMNGKVSLEFHEEEKNCEYCEEIKELLKELKEINENIHVKFEKNGKSGNSTKPYIEIKGSNKGKIFYHGLPAGYEFLPFLKAILYASNKKHIDIDREVENKLEEIKKPVEIKVFVTLTCIYCPIVAETSYVFSTLNENIVTHIIDTSEFPHLANKYNIRAVPHTFINDRLSFVGAVSPDFFLLKIFESLK